MRIKGTKGADHLTGTDGSDIIKGGRGADVIYGDDGTDTLYGGKGRDVFVFNDTDNDLDVIADFDPRRDTVILDLGTDFTAWSVDYTDMLDPLSTAGPPKPIGDGLFTHDTIRQVAVISEIGEAGEFSLLLI